MKKADRKTKDDLRAEYVRSDFGPMVRGKYSAKITKSSNVVVLDPEVSKAFPTAKDVNKALLSLTKIARASSGRSRRLGG
jgi:hypothetical protein